MIRLIAVFFVLVGSSLAGDGEGAPADIQTWHDNAGTVEGDTFQITSSGDISTELLITKAVVIQGQGREVTIITDKVTGNNSVFATDLAGAGKQTIYRDFQIRPDTTLASPSNTQAAIEVEGAGIIIVGRVKFGVNGSNEGLPHALELKNTSATGVCYDSVFLQVDGVYVRHEDWAGGVNGDGSWENVVNWGSGEFFFVEDCTIDNTGNVMALIDGNGGARVVVRYCNLTDAILLLHGNDSSNQQRSGRGLEAYENTFNLITGPTPGAVVDRGGTMIVHNNTVTGSYTDMILLTHYRRGREFRGWMAADGVVLWDEPDLTDGAGTPGGAGDGVFESGTSTAGAELTLTDTSKSWDATGSGEWSGYTLRITSGQTATSGGSGSITVSGAGWDASGTGEWTGWIVERDSDGIRGQVTSNTTDTLTLRGSPFPVYDWSSTGAFTLSRGAYIESNTATELTIDGGQSSWSYMQNGGGNYTFAASQDYEIRKIDWALDAPGRGVSSAWVGTRLENQNMTQGTDPTYMWGNDFKGGPGTYDVKQSYTKAGRDYMAQGTVKPGYSTYTYPHPLRDDALGDGTGTNATTATLDVGG